LENGASQSNGATPKAICTRSHHISEPHRISGCGQRAAQLAKWPDWRSGRAPGQSPHLMHAWWRGDWRWLEWRTANLSDKGRTMEAHQGELPTVRGRRRRQLQRIDWAWCARRRLRLAERTNDTVEWERGRKGRFGGWDWVERWRSSLDCGSNASAWGERKMSGARARRAEEAEGGWPAGLAWVGPSGRERRERVLTGGPRGLNKFNWFQTNSNSVELNLVQTGCSFAPKIWNKIWLESIWDKEQLCS
jgi:hypothetical protein